MMDHLETRSGVYADSVTLMQVSQRVGTVDGVATAFVAMATELNLQLLADAGFEVPDVGPNDLVVALRVEADMLDAALAEVEAALAAGRGGGETAGMSDGPPPRTVRDAAAGHDLALLSVPGPHVLPEALDAIEAGLDVMVFSDNVPVDHEVFLKSRAAADGLLVMGPDAGTAMVAGLGLGFANVVRPGPVGIVAASGTGAQQLTCLLDDAGVGISHVLAVGGRDLSAAVGGAASRVALARLDADPATEVIVLLSKPPDAAVADELRRFVAELDTPVVEALLGSGAPNLTEVAAEVAARFGEPVQPASWPTERQPGVAAELRGLFAGGTLCDEAIGIALGGLGEVASNLSYPGAAPLDQGLDTAGHVLVDLGEDEFTRGRPHPMIDQSLRLGRLAVEAERPGPRVVLLDVVLGHAAHPDPGGELAPPIAQACARDDLAVVVSLCGSAGDPQDRDRQVRLLTEAGAAVYLSNAEAAVAAVAHAKGAT